MEQYMMHKNSNSLLIQTMKTFKEDFVGNTTLSNYMRFTFITKETESFFATQASLLQRKIVNVLRQLVICYCLILLHTSTKVVIFIVMNLMHLTRLSIAIWLLQSFQSTNNFTLLSMQCKLFHGNKIKIILDKERLLPLITILHCLCKLF